MADTVAVMNAGRIEQLGDPAEIYEQPRTVFVANFLGQSNLIPGRRASVNGDVLMVEAHAQRFSMPTGRNSSSGESVIVGVRPEKITVIDPADAATVPAGANTVTGRVTDVSYSGVSTQYLVRAPWGQDLIAFEQNVKVGDRAVVGEEVLLHWSPEHTFGLDGAQDITAGIESAVLELEAAGGSGPA